MDGVGGAVVEGCEDVVECEGLEVVCRGVLVVERGGGRSLDGENDVEIWESEGS